MSEQNPYLAPPAPLSQSDEKMWAIVTHIAGIFFSFIPALITLGALGNRGPFIRHHSATALNFQLTMLIVYTAGTTLWFLVLPLLAVIAAGILTIIVSIVAAVAASNGQFYRYPLAIPFVR